MKITSVRIKCTTRGLVPLNSNSIISSINSCPSFFFLMFFLVKTGEVEVDCYLKLVQLMVTNHAIAVTS